MWNIIKTLGGIALLIAWGWLAVHLWRDGMEIFSGVIVALFALGIWLVLRGSPGRP